MIFTPWTYPECRTNCPLGGLLLSVMLDPISWFFVIVSSVAGFLICKFAIGYRSVIAYWIAGAILGTVSLLIYPG